MFRIKTWHPLGCAFCGSDQVYIYTPNTGEERLSGEHILLGNWAGLWSKSCLHSWIIFQMLLQFEKELAQAVEALTKEQEKAARAEKEKQMQVYSHDNFSERSWQAVVWLT